MARPLPRKPWQVILLLIVAAVIWALDQRKTAAPAPGSEKPASGSVARTGSYETFTGCRLEEHRQNDGDSFRVRLPGGRVEQFRLYYVDTPESDFRSYSGGATNHERIHEQAVEFGVTDEQAVQIGQEAKHFVHDLLARGDFTVQTRWDDPFGDKRYHAFVTPEGGASLDEMLVKKGFVRIHTKGAELPDGTPMKARLKQLHDLEAQAKREKRGVWGLGNR
jgi:endonuclease YncB( thermonuclease family)